jgi:hypothetical protein
MYSVCGLFEGLYKSVEEPDSIQEMDNRFGSGGKRELEYFYLTLYPNLWVLVNQNEDCCDWCYIENAQVSEKVVISYNPASKLVLFQTGAFLPVAQLCNFYRYQSHISELQAEPKPLINSRNMQFSHKNWD